MDLCGPMKNTTLGCAHYFMLMTDDCSREVWIYLLVKFQVVAEFHECIALVEDMISKKVQKIRSDNGGEFISHALHRFFSQRGVACQFSTANTPQQNGVVERKNRTVQERACSMLSQFHLPLLSWSKVVSTTVYIINCCPTKPIAEISPEAAFTGVKPSVSHFKAFGCDA